MMKIDKLVGYSFIVAIILLTTGCGSSATAKSDNTATDTVVATDKYDETQYDTTEEELYTEAEEQVADEYESETTSSTNIDDFIDGSTFYVDKYAESLGYTTLLNNNNYNSLLIDVGGTHYYISVSKTNYNLFYCKGDCTYGINTTDIDGEKTMEVSSGEKTKGCTSTWVNEIARLLEYIATTSPDEVDIESLDLEIRNSGTIYHGTGSFDENGAIDTDSLVGTNPELIWNENIDK